MSRKSDLAKRIGAVMDAVEETGLLTLPRRVEEVDGITGPGAEQVAKLTLAARSHDWVFSHVVNALQTLESLPPEAWKRPFMVAIPLRESFGEAVFHWDTAPFRRYASFHDFYHRELEQTFGRWSDLQALWQRRVAGELSDDQAKKHARDNAAELMAKAPDQVGPGQGARTDLQPRVHNTKLQRGSTNATYLAARIKRDRPDIAAAVERGEFKSMRAAAIAADIIKPPTPLDTLRRAWAKASAEEQVTFLKEVRAG